MVLLIHNKLSSYIWAGFLRFLLCKCTCCQNLYCPFNATCDTNTKLFHAKTD